MEYKPARTVVKKREVYILFNYSPIALAAISEDSSELSAFLSAATTVQHWDISTKNHPQRASAMRATDTLTQDSLRLKADDISLYYERLQIA